MRDNVRVVDLIWVDGSDIETNADWPARVALRSGARGERGGGARLAAWRTDDHLNSGGPELGRHLLKSLSRSSQGARG